MTKDDLNKMSRSDRIKFYLENTPPEEFQRKIGEVQEYMHDSRTIKLKAEGSISVGQTWASRDGRTNFYNPRKRLNLFFDKARKW